VVRVASDPRPEDEDTPCGVRLFGELDLDQFHPQWSGVRNGVDYEAAGEEAHRVMAEIDGVLQEHGLSKDSDIWPQVRIDGVAFVTVRLPVDSWPVVLK
jgi:hypothetical protein